MQTVSITTRLPKELKEKATALAAADDRSFSYFVQKAVEARVAEQQAAEEEKGRFAAVFERNRKDINAGTFYTEAQVLDRIDQMFANLDPDET